jgi:hypothetical protein
VYERSDGLGILILCFPKSLNEILQDEKIFTSGIVGRHHLCIEDEGQRY